MKKREKIYYAGLFDGRGIIGIHEGRWPEVSVRMRGNTPKKLYKLFGGTCFINAGTSWWKARGKDAVVFLATLLPYLRVYKKQAKHLTKKTLKNSR